MNVLRMYLICSPVMNVHEIVLLKREFEIMKAFLLIILHQSSYTCISMFHKISALVNIIYKCVKKNIFCFQMNKIILFHGIKDMLTSIYNRFLREQNSNFYTIIIPDLQILHRS